VATPSLADQLAFFFPESDAAMSTYSVKDKVALVTGSARGIGFETARHLIERGARVAIVDMDHLAAAEAANWLGERAIALPADVTDSIAMVDVVDEVVVRLGRLDVVVASASMAPEPSTTRAMTPLEFESVLDVNLFGVYRTVHPALPHIIANGGHAVLVASVHAFVDGVQPAPYAMSRAGVEQFGRSLRGELAQRGATAGVASFELVDTVIAREGFDSAGKAITDGIENRAPWVTTPKQRRTYSLLRGLLKPALDRRTGRNVTIQGDVRDADLLQMFKA
jgi:NAD(P)-dependent dehydrogenase (short-subunit alcohol dehydrogenase family)